jgi:hypothetical protein
MFSYPDTLSRFRSGAFLIGEPIYPIIIKYNKHLSDTNINNFILKLGSNLNECVEIKFLKPFYPPFNENSPDVIRQYMSSEGNLLMSRVMGNDIKDKIKAN